MPVTSLRTSLLFVCAALIVTATACGSVTDAMSSDFTVHVDSITGPNAVSGGIAANAFLWGTVGPSGCTRLSELRVLRSPSQVDATVVGERVGGAACADGTVTLKGLVLKLDPPISYDFLIVVHQPDGSTLTRRIYGE